MKVLILAAGPGSRLKERTKEVPKCLVKVAGKAMIEYQLEAIKANNIKDIIVVAGHKANKLKDFLSQDKFNDLNIKIIENKEYKESNSSYSWWLALNEIKNEPYIHLNCDIIFFPELLAKLLRSKEGSILINKDIELNESMEQAIVKGDKIVNIKLGSNLGAVGRASGMAKLSPTNIEEMRKKIEGWVKSGDKNKHCYGAIRDTLKQTSYYMLDPKTSFFREINDLEELSEAEEAIKWYSKKKIIMMHGNPATGKSVSAEMIYKHLLKSRHVELLSTLDVRKSLNLMDLESKEDRKKVYIEFAALVDNKLKSQDLLILDGNFATFKRRKNIYSLIEKHNAELYIFNLITDRQTIEKRMIERRSSSLSKNKADTMEIYDMIAHESDLLSNDETSGNTYITTLDVEKRTTKKRNIKLNKVQKKFVDEIIGAMLGSKRSIPKSKNKYYQAIIFDIGGVIQNSRWGSVSNQLVDLKKSLDANSFKAAFYSEKNKFWDRYKAGKMNGEIFWGHVASELGLPKKTSKRIKKAFVNIYDPVNPNVAEVVESLKQYKLIILSNSCPEVQENVESNKFYDIFNKIYFSHKIKMKKPDKEIFEYVLGKNNLEPSSCVFIDDKLENVQSAESLGITSILFTGADDLEKELNKLLT